MEGNALQADLEGVKADFEATRADLSNAFARVEDEQGVLREQVCVGWRMGAAFVVMFSRVW